MKLKFKFRRSRDELENYARRLEGKAHDLTKALQKKEEELKEIKGQLLHAAKMTSIGEISAGVAHELNNPLGGILGYAQFMLEKLNSSNTDKCDVKKMAEYVDHIEREASRCKGIVENLLIFARKSNAVKAIDVRDILNDALAIMSHQLKLANVSVSVDAPTSGAKSRGNASQLQQVFTNIILNAQQSMPAGGELKISLRQTDDKYDISFEDTGCGISRQNLDKIFQPFFTTKEGSKGLGLGLKVSSLIVKEHKGAISVKSEPKKGSVFTVTLPFLSR